MDRQKEIEQLKASINATIKQLAEDQDRLFILANRPDLIEVAPEPKEPETWEDVSKFGGGGHPFSWNCESQQHCIKLEKFIRRLEIADYCGRVDRDLGQTYTICINDEGTPDIGQFIVDAIGDNHFPTKEAAEKYLKICLNSNLL